MNELYETKISTARWIAYDIPGNIGWMIYFVCFVRLVRQGVNLFTVAALVPAFLMLIGIIELIGERIAKLDRILPRKRLLRGFGSLTLGGILGAVISMIGVITVYCNYWMLLGSVLCAAFAGLLYKGYRKAEGKEFFSGVLMEVLMKKHVFRVNSDGYNGAWYPTSNESSRGLIIMLGDSSEDRMAKTGAKWLNEQGIHVLAMSPDKKDYGHHNYPLERFDKAIAFMKAQGCDKLGVVGASTTGMMALLAASYYPEFSLTIAISPPDFVMEGFYQDGKDGMRERPGDNESSVSWQNKPLSYLPYAYRHPEYWKKIQEESKSGGDKVASRKMFDESERRHPIQEEERIKVENIHGKIIFIGAEDDVLWDTCKYIRRMEERLAELPHDSTFESWLYEHGTHFAFPQSMLKMMLPVGSELLISFMFRAGKEHKKECRGTRIDIDRRLKKALAEW